MSLSYNQYNNFNLLRLFAALQVVYTHTLEHLNIENELLINIGHFLRYFPGVTIFFLISGYLITMSYDKNSNVKEYIKNRVLRIYPALYVNFIIGFLILLYFNQFENISLFSIISWSVAQLTFFQFYNPEFIRDFGVGVINGSLWTISVELAFYIILPFIYIYLKNNFYKKFIGLMLLSLVFYYYNININTKTFIYEKLISASILPHLFYFLIGFYLYKYRDSLIKYLENKVLIFTILYGIAVYVSIDNFLYLLIKQFIFALFIFSIAFSYKTLTYSLIKHNDFTYGIYIYHMLIVNLFVQLGLMGGGSRISIWNFNFINNFWNIKLLFNRETIFKIKKEKFI
jgi:peptidoglycan/LPS O-acetylase OafA/YrhL